MALRENPLWNGYLTISHSCFHSFCRRKECLLFFNVPRSISQTCHIFHSIPYYVRKYWPRSKAFVAFYRQYASAAIKTKNEWRLCRIVRNTVICHLNSYLILRCLAPWSFQYFRSHEFFFLSNLIRVFFWNIQIEMLSIISSWDSWKSRKKRETWQIISTQIEIEISCWSSLNINYKTRYAYKILVLVWLIFVIMRKKIPFQLY